MTCACTRRCSRNHPHDARGVLSYWRGGLGAYGYLAHAFAEDDLLREVAKNNPTTPCACVAPCRPTLSPRAA